MATEHFDVLFVGAGISGIGGAYHIQKSLPGKSFAILEARSEIGGTWSLFRYPGIRSDVDMHTFGFGFKPWRDREAIADGDKILAYLNEAIDENGLRPHIRLNQRLTQASWSSKTARWTVTIDQSGIPSEISCTFLYFGSGYYSYSEGHYPEFPDQDKFAGTIVKPQFWPENLDYKGKKIVVIGSGATAITIVPSIADDAAHVTMLQRSPTYVVPRPAQDKVANFLFKYMPDKIAYPMVRWRNILMGMYFFNLCKKQPDKVKTHILSMVREVVGPDYDIATHFTPSYKPWDQRMCVVRDGDMFRQIRSGKVSVVTDHIDRFTTHGIKTVSGIEIPADIIVSATGLKAEIFSGVKLEVDGRVVLIPETIAYKGFMYSGIPNLVLVTGYSNAGWTLKADLISEYICRLIGHMDKTGSDYCVPDATGVVASETPPFALESGYIMRALDRMPKQGTAEPWVANNNYFRDLMQVRYAKIDDGVIKFRKAAADDGAANEPAMLVAAE